MVEANQKAECIALVMDALSALSVEGAIAVLNHTANLVREFLQPAEAPTEPVTIQEEPVHHGPAFDAPVPVPPKEAAKPAARATAQQPGTTMGKVLEILRTCGRQDGLFASEIRETAKVLYPELSLDIHSILYRLKKTGAVVVSGVHGQCRFSLPGTVLAASTEHNETATRMLESASKKKVENNWATVLSKRSSLVDDDDDDDASPEDEEADDGEDLHEGFDAEKHDRLIQGGPRGKSQGALKRSQQRDLVAFVDEKRSVTQEDVATRLNVSTMQAASRLNTIAAHGMIDHVETNRWNSRKNPPTN